ncbi:NAD(P)H-hydrate dehydratase [Maricaulis sp.]|uniref:NAD(P)H-hydrate dehydratase n=1 Tax=Maricaulis sp. TaxID=1486257 RepID=UPI00261CB7F0|nr:NAD(P)H-hydrate dehydratase [Maricaulis sp.]
MHDDVLSTKDCGACDRYAVENGVASQGLMDKAGRAMADAIRARWARRPVHVLCGPGNNGGDGFVAAAALREAGWDVRVALLGDAGSLKGDAAWARDAWGMAAEPAEPGFLEGAGLIVDALFGAGLSRPLDGPAAALADAMTRAGVPVIAADLPSGLPGDGTAKAGPVAPATLTVTFHARKPAHVLDPAASLCGEVVVADIGIPGGWRSVVTPVAAVNTPAGWLAGLPVERRDDHKHARGRLAVFTGGVSSTGAARLAARAGLRMGAGLVTLVSPPEALLVNAAASTAVMVRRWADAPEAGPVLAELRADAAVLGPALGVGEAAREAVRSAAGQGAALVLDADALTSFEDDPAVLFSLLRTGDVLTPHEGEFRRLFPDLGPESGNRIERTRRAAERAGCIVLLKGPDTVVAAPGHTPAVNRHASPALATAGSGDVLAGMIGGLLVRGMPAVQAACAAAWLHGDAGRRLGPGLIAEDLPEILPECLHDLARAQRRRAAASHLLEHKS